MAPEQLVKQKHQVPDFSLLHPDSVEARLQKYIVLSYPGKKELNAGKVALERNPRVISAIENKKGAFLTTPNDEFFFDWNQYQSGMFDLNLPTAWSKTTGHAYIGVPDSGIDVTVNVTPPIPPTTSHPDLTNFRRHFSTSFTTDPKGYQFRAAHGTHVTGIIAATSNNTEGVAGGCWDCAIAFAQINTLSNILTEGYDVSCLNSLEMRKISDFKAQLCTNWI